jgi:hypothetical protein
MLCQPALKIPTMQFDFSEYDSSALTVGLEVLFRFPVEHFYL